MAEIILTLWLTKWATVSYYFTFILFRLKSPNAKQFKVLPNIITEFVLGLFPLPLAFKARS